MDGRLDSLQGDVAALWQSIAELASEQQPTDVRGQGGSEGSGTKRKRTE